MAERRMRLLPLLGLAGLLALVATIVVPPRPRLVWNVSASAPLGLYRVTPDAPAKHGDFVIARVPEQARNLAAARHYIPANVPLLKRIAATPGERICAADDSIFINGRRAARRLARDARGRPMPWWHGCITLQPGSLLLLMTDSSGSFDGRYFGPTAAADILGKADLIWAR